MPGIAERPKAAEPVAHEDMSSTPVKMRSGRRPRSQWPIYQTYQTWRALGGREAAAKRALRDFGKIFERLDFWLNEKDSIEKFR
jgi:hypothetical protein